jgi:hypothetical protein
MKRMRLFLALFTFAALVPVFSEAALQSLRATYTVLIILDVTNPLGYEKHAAPAPAAGSNAGAGIVARMVVNRNEDPRNYRAEQLSFAGGNLVAQNVKQGAVEVQASISPNPLGTLLYCSDSAVPVGCTSVTESVTAGTQATISCAYSMVVDTTQTNWTLDHGLFTDFENTMNVVAFPGKDMYNNTHIGTPLPSYTPFVVYSDGQAWAVAGASGGMKSFCVDLQITVPTSVSTGTYSSNATYSLYY